MSTVSFYEGVKSALPALNSEDRVIGAFYITTDTNELFVSETSSYNKVSDIVIVEHENQLPLAGTQKSNKIYYVSDTNSLYKVVETSGGSYEWERSGEDTFAEIDEDGAVALANALNLSADVGSSTKGVYFENGVPVEMTYSVNSDVPSGAVFSDTVYSEGTGITITNNNTIKAKLKSDTASALTAAAKGNTANREYAVGLDAAGHLSVNVPWEGGGEGGAVSSVNSKTGDVVLDASDVGAIASSLKGANSGVAELDATGKVPSSQLPSYVDDVIEGYYKEADGKFYKESTYTTEITGETGKIYISLDTDVTYRWSGSVFVAIGSSLALGETSSTAYRGDRGKSAYDHATDSSRLTTAQSSGLYKISTTAEGHVAGVTAVQKSDITALGIPAQDTTYNTMTSEEAKTGTDTTAKLVTAKVIDDAIVNKGYTTNTGTVTSVAPGVGLAGDTVTGTGTLKAKLKSETASALTAASKGSTADREYAVGVDADGNLSVNVPWNSGSSGGGVIEGYYKSADGKFYEESTYETEIAGEIGQFYVTLDTNLSYRYNGTSFVEVSKSLELGTTSSTAYRGDYGNTAYTHATDSSRLTTAQSSGLYKISTTAEGHVAGVTAVQKSDITALGIPESDTTYDTMTSDEAKTGTSTTSKLVTAKVIDDAIVNKGYTTNTGTVTGVTAGAGLSGGTVSTSGTIKANLKSESLSSLTADSKGSTANREYAVGLDANGNLSVNVPWQNTTPVTSVNEITGDVVLVAADIGAVDIDDVGVAGGVASLDENGLVPSTQLPSYVDDVIEGYYDSTNGRFYKDSTYTTQITPESGKIYVSLDTDVTYRWSGSIYVEISKSLTLGTTSSTAYRGDYGNTAYGHATDATRLQTAQSSGLYKISTTAEGHVAGVTAVQKSDITALGIPAQDTTYEEMDSSEAQTGTSTTSKLISAKTLDDAITNKGYTTNTGTVTGVTAGVGLAGGTVSTSGTVKANLKSETASTLTAASKGNTADREYAVGVDANGNLSVNVPWVDNNTEYTQGTGISIDSSNQIALASGVATPGTSGSTSAQTPGFGGTFTVPYVTIDTYGRTTAAGTANVTIPNSGASSNAAGLMSSTHYSKVENLPKWSNSANAAIDATSVTISDASITSNSVIEPFSSTASGKPVVWKKMTTTSGQVTIEFASALTEAASFKVKITNSFT